MGGAPLSLRVSCNGLEACPVYSLTEWLTEIVEPRFICDDAIFFRSVGRKLSTGARPSS